MKGLSPDITGLSDIAKYIKSSGSQALSNIRLVSFTADLAAAVTLGFMCSGTMLIT